MSCTTNTGKRPKAWISWSSGKDSTFALHAARHDDAVDVVGLLVTFNGDADRVAMHAVRRILVEDPSRTSGTSATHRRTPLAVPQRGL